MSKHLSVEKKSSGTGAKQRKKRAEDILQDKYYKTLDLINAMRNKDQKDGRKTTIHIKKTTLTDEGDDFEFANGTDSNTQTLKRGDLNDLGLNINSNATINVQNVEENEKVDFFMAKFGVSSVQPSSQTLHQENNGPGDSANNNVQCFDVEEAPRDAKPTLTKEIFQEDKRQALPIETATSGAVITADRFGERIQASKDPKIELSGFRNYLEQEELDRASINDFISSKRSIRLNHPSKTSLFVGSRSRKEREAAPADSHSLNAKSEVSTAKSRADQGARGNLNTGVTGQKTTKQKISMEKLHSRLSVHPSDRGSRNDEIDLQNILGQHGDGRNSRLDSASVVEPKQRKSAEFTLQRQALAIPSDEVSKYQGGNTPNKFNGTAADPRDDKSRDSALERRLSNRVRVAIDQLNIENRSNDAKSQIHHEIPSKKSTKKLNDDRSESAQSEKYSYMGRMVRSIQLNEVPTKKSTQQGGKIPQISLVPPDYRSVELPKNFMASVAKQFKKQPGKRSKKTINQDSFLIQHEFDAGKSKLTQRIEQTHKAQIRMQQLMAMLRHKDPNKHLLYLSELDYSETHAQNDADADAELTEEPELVDHEKGTKGSQGSDDKPFKYQPVRSMSLHSTHQWASRLGSLRCKSKDYEEIETQIQSKLDKKTSKRESVNVRDSGIRILGTGILGSDYDSVQAPIIPTGGKPVGVKNLTGSVNGESQRNHDSINGDSLVLEGSFLEKLADEENDLKRSNSSRFNINTSLDPSKNKSLNVSILRSTIGRNRQDNLGSIVQTNRFGSVTGTHANQKVKKQIINTGLLTSVPKQGRMIDTQKYIRQNLQAYADNEYFGFTKRPRDLKPLPASAKNSKLLMGDMDTSLKTLDTKAFYSPVNMSQSIGIPIMAQSQSLKPAGKRGKLFNLSATMDGKAETSGYDPIILPKKKANRSMRIRKSRNRGATHNQKDPRAMTMIAEEPDMANEGNEMDHLIDENADLVGQLEDMIAIFEQYMKVAALEKKADSLESRRASQNETPLAGGSVPDMGPENSMNRSMNDNQGQNKWPEEKTLAYKPEIMQHTSQPMIVSDSQLHVYGDTSPTRSHAKLEKQIEPFSILIAPQDDSMGAFSKVESSKQKQKSQNKSKTNMGSTSKRRDRKEKMLASFQLKEGFFMNHHMPFIKSPTETVAVLTRQQDTMGLTLKSFASQKSYKVSQSGLSPTNSLPLSPRYQLKPNTLSILAANEHKTHNEWLKKIRDLWDQLLGQNTYNEVGRVEAELRESKQKLQVLTQQNMRANAKVLDLEYKTISKPKQIAKNQNNVTARKAEKLGKKLATVQLRFKKETERHQMFNMWGLQSHVISYVVKVRLLEDLIDLAQKQKVRPDAAVGREMFLMHYLYEQADKDMRGFLKKRDKDKWRTWDNPRRISFVKPDAAEHPDETRLRTCVGFMYGMDTDARVHAKMCQEMVVFLNYCFGSEAWYTLWKLKYHRESNKQRQLEINGDIQGSHQKHLAAQTERIKSLNWLQLTEGHQDMIVVGPEPLWLAYVRAAQKRKAAQQLSTAIDSHKFGGLEGGPHPMPFESHILTQNGTDEDEFIKIGLASDDDEDEQEHNVLSRSSDSSAVKIMDVDDEEIEAEKQAEWERQERERNLLEEQRQREEDEELLRVRQMWQDTIDSRKVDDENQRKQLQDARAKRLARLFRDDQNSDNEEADEEPLYKHLDYGAAASGIDSLIDKVEVHLQVEMNILRKWKEKDFQEVKKEARNHFPSIKNPVVRQETSKSPFMRGSRSPTILSGKSAIQESLLERRAFRKSIDKLQKMGTRRSKDFSQRDYRESERGPQAVPKVQKKQSRSKPASTLRSKEPMVGFDEKNNPYLPSAK